MTSLSNAMSCITCQGPLSFGIPGKYCLICRPPIVPSLNTPLTVAENHEDAYAQRARFDRLDKGTEFPGFRG